MACFLPLVASCGPGAMGWSQDVDDLITREACSVTVDKSILGPNTDVDIMVKITPVNTSPIVHVHPTVK